MPRAQPWRQSGLTEGKIDAAYAFAYDESLEQTSDSPGNLNLSTLPEISTNDVYVPGCPGLQSVNHIDVPQLQQQVYEAFYGSAMIPSTASSVTVDVYNGSATYGLAADVSKDLVAMGYQAGAVEDSSPQSQPVGDDTEVFYGAGNAADANAQMIANVMGVQDATPLSSLPAGHVEALLGSPVTAQAPGLEMFAADTVNALDYVTAAQIKTPASQSGGKFSRC